MGATPPQIPNQPGGARVQGGPLGVPGKLGVAPVNLGAEAPGPIHPHPDSTLPPLLTRSFLSLARCGRKTARSPEASSSAAASECQCRVTTGRGGGEVGPLCAPDLSPQPPEPLMVTSAGMHPGCSCLPLQFLEPRPLPGSPAPSFCALTRPRPPQVQLPSVFLSRNPGPVQ